MIAAIADTHAVIWYLAKDARLSSAAKSTFEVAVKLGDLVGISSITLVEMVYLIEKGRIPPERFTQLANILDNQGSVLVEIPVDLKIARALARVDVVQIPDMPDRIVAATALQLNVPVISRDAKIQASGLTTIW